MRTRLRSFNSQELGDGMTMSGVLMRLRSASLLMCLTSGMGSLTMGGLCIACAVAFFGCIGAGAPCGTYAGNHCELFKRGAPRGNLFLKHLHLRLVAFRQTMRHHQLSSSSLHLHMRLFQTKGLHSTSQRRLSSIRVAGSRSRRPSPCSWRLLKTEDG